MSSTLIRDGFSRRLQDGRLTGMSVLIFGIVSCGLAMIGCPIRASATEPTDDPSGKFFAQYCHGCHAGAEPKGDFHIDTLAQDFADKENRRQWLNVVQQLRAGTMPPTGKPRPAKDQTKDLTDWIDGQVASAETARNALQGARSCGD